ncbi:unnamed protein product [Moneuplotes crassus]|uniref:Uncharacterized protein n=1 Tax=Euplotes crassus TaxID=5936 RepID=A0AAD1Y4D5_EUPCR|nr:unnamed protein product [Moneuplotes crassus]
MRAILLLLIWATAWGLENHIQDYKGRVETHLKSIDEEQDDPLVSYRDKKSVFVLQENEVIRMNLKQYFGGSFLEYSLNQRQNYNCDEELQSCYEKDSYQFINLPSEFYKLIRSGSYSMKEHVGPLSDMLRLLTWHQEGSPEKTYLLYVTEDYHLKFVDVSNINVGQDIEVLYSKNLIPIIRNQYAKVKIKDIYCNSLSTVKTNKLYIIGCKHKDNDFVIWISLEIYPKNVYSMSILPRKAEFNIDSLGRNSITTGLIDDYCYLIATTSEYGGLVQVSVFDTSKVKYKNIKFINSATYNISDFIDPFENRNLEGEFNFRDVIYYKSNYKYKDDEVQENHHIIASCYNCGIIFFKIQKYEADKTIGHRFLNLTYMYKKPTIGRIFTEKSFNLKNTDFKFFTSIATPPVIYEFMVDESANVNVNKVFSDNIRDNRYKDCELISVNAKYIAQLLYDRKLLKQVIRVYDRNETNFSVGHIHIPLNGYRYDISGIQFLSYLESNKIFVRNPEKWEIYDILDPELIIDTFNYDNYSSHIGENFMISINAKSPIESSVGKTLNVSIVCVGSESNISFNILESPNVEIKYAYGDPSFELPISNYFVGPNLNFTVEIVGASDENFDIKLPKIINPENPEIQYVDFESKLNCTNNVFNQYKDKILDEPMVSFFCIQSNFIEHHKFLMKDMTPINTTLLNYTHLNFVGHYNLRNSSMNILILLSKDQHRDKFDYSLNFFDIQKGMLIWVKKITVDLKKTLRELNSIIKFYNSEYLALFSKNEEDIYFICEDPKLNDYHIKLKQRVRDIFLIKDKYLYFTHYQKSYVTVHKIYQVKEDDKLKLSSEWLCDAKVDQNYILADIGRDGFSIFIRGNNITDVYSIKNVCNMQFEKRLLLFDSPTHIEYFINNRTNEPVYHRTGKYLFIVARDSTYTFLKYLIIYNIKTSAHNSLISKIDLSFVASKFDNYVFTEKIASSSLIAIYVYYDVNIYEYFEFQPNNLLVSLDSNDLFVSLNKTNIQEYPEKGVILKLKQSKLIEPPTYKWEYPLYLFVNVANKGLMIQNRLPDQLYKFPQNDEPLTFSVLDIFDGFDMSYDPLQIGGNTEDVDLDMSEDKISKFILDGVSLNNPVSHALVYKKKYLLAFYEKDYKLEIYNLANSSDIPFPDSYEKQLDSCNIDYISTFTLVPENSINDTTMFYLVCNCRINDTGINPSYRLQFYRFNVSENMNMFSATRFYTDPIERMNVPLDRKVKDVKVSNFQTGRESHHIVILADSQTMHDSVLYYYGLSFNEEQTRFKLIYYSELNGLQMNYDKFKVNSFMFIRGSKFMVCSVDDFGLLFYDLDRLEKTDEVAFSEFFTSFYPEFKITNLVPISNNSMRIFLENKGSVSLVWKNVYDTKIGKYLLDGLEQRDRFVNLNNQQSTGIVDYSDLSIVQIGYNLKRGGFLDAFVRVERHMNHCNSKSFREYNLGTVLQCTFIDLQCSEDRIVAICGDKYYIINYHPFPSLKVTKHSKATSSTFQLKASNSYSETSVLFEIGNTDTTTLFSKWGILFIFVAVVLILTWCIRCTFRQVVKAKPGSDSVILASEPSSVKDVKFSHDASTEVLKKIKLTYASRATFRKSVKMKRGYSEFHDDVEFDLTHDDTNEEPMNIS